VTRRLRRTLALVAGLAVAIGAAAVAGAAVSLARFDASMARVYDTPIRAVTRSEAPSVLARGKHLVESVGTCTMSLCHGPDLGGGATPDMGPLGSLAGPNVTPGGVAATYTDGELARLVQHGIKRDGRSVCLMPSEDFGWLPDADVDAIISYLRSVPAVDRVTRPVAISAPIKWLDRLYDFPVDIARRVEAHPEPVPEPAPTAGYGALLARACRHCHGDHFSGGRVPGLPPSMTTPLNLTSDATGLALWTFEDFERTMRQGIRRNGTALSDYMPIDAFRQLDDTEMRSLWAYLRALPPVPFGSR
jgi:hypothetical protein